MRAWKKQCAGILMLLTILFTLTGCCGYEIELTTDDNFYFDIHRTFGYDTSIQPGGGLNVFGREYAKSMELFDENIEIMDWGPEQISTLNKALESNVFGENIKLGNISVKYDLQEYSGKDIWHPAICLDINSGLNAEGLYNKYKETIEKWVGKDIVEQYRNGDTTTRENIEDQWMPHISMKINFAAPVSVQAGSQWVETNGNSVTINIGQMMRDNGGRVVLFSSNVNLNQDAVHLFDKSGQSPDENSQEGNQNSKFNDVDSNAWYAEAVQYCVDRGIMNGYGNGNFGPNDTVTVAQLCQIMFNNGVEDEYLYDIYDIDHWAKTAVGWCTYRNLILDSDIQQNGIIAVDKIDQGMTREQAISSLAKFAQYKGNTPQSINYNIPDGADINNKYRDSIDLAYQYGITTGVDSTGRFSPLTPVTRAQICQIFYNMKW